MSAHEWEFEGQWHRRHLVHNAQNADENLNVPYLYENGDKVVLNWNWLDNDWNVDNPALRFATLFNSPLLKSSCWQGSFVLAIFSNVCYNLWMQDTDVNIVLSILQSNSELEFAGVFGSRARGEARPGSDLDLLVRFKHPQGLLRLSALQRQISEELGIPVDLVTERSLSMHIKDKILEEVQTIYGQR
ncbi:MAG TPA: nucleotidyltransferase family protein [Candidatus Paceibacterota bacterium]